jgi:hypothetical protein
METDLQKDKLLLIVTKNSIKTNRMCKANQSVGNMIDRELFLNDEAIASSDENTTCPF